LQQINLLFEVFVLLVASHPSLSLTL